METEIINLLDLLKRVHINVIENARRNQELKKFYLYQVTEQLHRKIISLVESVIILNRHYKYAESQMIQRNIFETAIFILYLQKFPFESERWLNWNNLSFIDKENIPKKYEAYKQYLIDKGHTDTVAMMNKDNYRSIRNFSPTFIRDMAFRDHPDLEGNDFKEYYTRVCKFAHPSFLSMAKNDRLDVGSKEDIEKSVLFILLESSTIFVDILTKFIDTNVKETFEKAYSLQKELLSKT